MRSHEAVMLPNEPSGFYEKHRRRRVADVLPCSPTESWTAMATTDLSIPADTQTMGIVHDALRRDLGRVRTALTTPPYPGDDQQVATADHVLWMVDFLHHHEAEDDGLFPLIRERNPEAAALLDRMDADHQGILPGMDGLAAAAGRYRSAASAREGVLAALDALEGFLLPHLRREEDEMMPVVSATLTEAEWQAWEQHDNAKNRTKLELADLGHWIIDGQTAARRDKMTSAVPPPMRFVLLHGFAGRYRRMAYRRWRTQEFARRRLSWPGGTR